MANKVYPKGKKHIASDVNLLTDTIKIAIIDTADDTYSEADEFLGDLAAGAVVAKSAALTSKTLTVVTDAGDDYVVFDADDTSCSGVTGDSVEAYIVYKDTGSDATSPVLEWVDHDGSNATFTVTPNGGAINITFDAAGILRIN